MGLNSGLKRPNWGCGSRGPNAPSATLQAVKHFYIIEVHWNDAQPGTSGGTIAPSPLTAISAATLANINGAVKDVRLYNDGTDGTRTGTPHVRTVTDGVITGGTTLTSATAAFVAGDVGQYIVSDAIPLGTKIASRTSGTVVVLDTTCVNNAGPVIFEIGQRQGLRLRIETGQYTPPWARGGLPPVQLASTAGTICICPQWWAIAPRQLWLPGGITLGPVQFNYANFILGLANLVLYDGVTLDNTPEVREVTVGLTMVAFGESFWRFASVANNGAGISNATAYTNAGFTGALDHLAMQRAMQIHGTAFQNTITMLDCNGYDAVNNDLGGAPGGGSFSDKKAWMTDILDFALGVGAYSTVLCDGLAITNASLIGGQVNIDDLLRVYGPLGSGIVIDSSDPQRNKQAAQTFQTYPQNKGLTTGRRLTDGVITGTTTLTSATAAFVAGDVGSFVVSTAIPPGTKIASRTSATVVILDTVCTNNAGPITFLVGDNLANTLAQAITYGATSVEIINPTSGDTDASILTAIQSGNYDQGLMQNRAGAVPSPAGQDWPWNTVTVVPPPTGVPGEFPSSTTGPGQ